MCLGGMKADIFDSMAEGVSGSACLVCFMTQAYQDSKNCALELKFVSGGCSLCMRVCVYVCVRACANARARVCVCVRFESANSV